MCDPLRLPARNGYGDASHAAPHGALGSYLTGPSRSVIRNECDPPLPNPHGLLRRDAAGLSVS